jgi:hypothetical protein
MDRIEVPITIKFVIFGIDAEYQVYILLDEDGLPSFEFDGDYLSSFLKKTYYKLLKFDMAFSPPVLVDVEGDSKKPGLTIFYSVNIPLDTLNLEGFKWVKPNETTMVQVPNDGKVQLSVPEYNAVFSALGSRRYEHFASARTAKI